MALVTTTEMFRKAYAGGYAIGAFNINNMEIVQAITEAAGELRSPVILQVSAGARKYAKQEYLMALAQAAIRDADIDLALHLAAVLPHFLLAGVGAVAEMSAASLPL